MTEKEIEQKVIEIINLIKGLTYREYRQVFRQLENKVEVMAVLT